MRFGGQFEREGGGDDCFYFAGFDSAIEFGEFADAGDGVVGENFDAFSFFGFGFDAVGIAKAAVGFESGDALLERFSAGGGEDGVDAVGGETAGGFGEVLFFAVSRRISAE